MICFGYPMLDWLPNWLPVWFLEIIQDLIGFFIIFPLWLTLPTSALFVSGSWFGSNWIIDKAKRSATMHFS
jgi:hypothetical protein